MKTVEQVVNRIEELKKINEVLNVTLPVPAWFISLDHTWGVSVNEREIKILSWVLE